LTPVIRQIFVGDLRLAQKSFLSILSIKCRNWFYWADGAERADRAETKESPVSMRILVYVVKIQ
jgi:hypothetical protein